MLVDYLPEGKCSVKLVAVDVFVFFDGLFGVVLVKDLLSVHLD